MSDLILLALVLVAAGGLSGFLAGLFGVGGGTVVVPVLYEVFVMIGVPDELRMPLCAGTSLALIIPTSIASFTSHCKTNAVNSDLLRLWSVPIIAGVIGGTVVARYASAAVFKTVFVLVALLTAVRLIFRDRFPTLGQDVPRDLQIRLRFDHWSVRVVDRNWRRNPFKHDHDVPWAGNPRICCDVGRSGRDGFHPGSSRIHGGRMGSDGSTTVLRRVRINRGGVGSHAGELFYGATGRAGCASCVQATARALLCNVSNRGGRTVWVKSCVLAPPADNVRGPSDEIRGKSELGYAQADCLCDFSRRRAMTELTHCRAFSAWARQKSGDWASGGVRNSSLRS